MSRLATDDPAHRRIVAQTFGAVHVLVPGKPTVNRLPQHPNKSVPAVICGSSIRERLPGRCTEANPVVEFAVDAQPSIVGHKGVAKLQRQTAIESNLRAHRLIHLLIPTEAATCNEMMSPLITR